jgi:hypothetical protein
MFICYSVIFLSASVLSAIFQVSTFCFAAVMRYIIALNILLFTFTAVDVIFVLGHWPMARHRFVLPGILTSASFHKIDFRDVPKNSYHFSTRLEHMMQIFVD